MKTKRVLRYYCDHCGKGGCGKAAMLKHEKRCIKNPNRECGFCKLEDIDPVPMRDLVLAIGRGLDDLRKTSRGCPACMLSAIVQSKIQEDDGDGPGRWIQWDYKKARDEFFAERTERNHINMT